MMTDGRFGKDKSKRKVPPQPFSWLSLHKCAKRRRSGVEAAASYKSDSDSDNGWEDVGPEACHADPDWSPVSPDEAPLEKDANDAMPSKT